jgi:DNA-binding SARP family transcriptional activator
LGTYLMAHAGKSVARDALMDLLWPEVDPSRATAHFQDGLLRLEIRKLPAQGGRGGAA